MIIWVAAYPAWMRLRTFCDAPPDHWEMRLPPEGQTHSASCTVPCFFKIHHYPPVQVITNDHDKFRVLTYVLRFKSEAYRPPTAPLPTGVCIFNTSFLEQAFRMFYSSFIESVPVPTFSFVCCFRKLSIQNRKWLQGTVKMCSETAGIALHDLSHLYVNPGWPKLSTQQWAVSAFTRA